MQPPENVAKAVYFMDGDETASPLQAMVIEYNSERWLVATWLQHRASGTRYPDRIIPMKQLPHVVQASGLIQLGRLMPKELFLVEAPQELLQQFGAQVYPSVVHIPAPPSSH